MKDKKQRWYCCFLGDEKLFEDFNYIISNLPGLAVISYKKEEFYDRDDHTQETMVRDVVIEASSVWWKEGYRYLLTGFRFEEVRES